MKYFLYSFVLFTLVFVTMGSYAVAADNIVVVVAKKSPIPKLTHAQVKALYLGETKHPVPGTSIVLHDRDRTLPIFKEFYSALVSMTPKQVTIHWSRKVFTGEASPPTREMGDDGKVVEMLKAKPEAISYIYEKNLNPALRVVYSLKEN